MPRTTLTKISAAGPYAHTGTVLTFTVADTVNLNDFVFNGGEIVLVRNVGVGSQNVVLNSSNDPFSRTKDITFSVPAGTFIVFGPFDRTGWVQSDGKFRLSSASTDIQFAVINLE